MPDTKATEAEEAAAPPAAQNVDAERIAEIIRGHLRDSPVSREVAAWNFLQSKLPAIAEDILKER